MQKQEPLVRESVVAYKLLGPPSVPAIGLANYLPRQLALWLLLLLAAVFLLTVTSYRETVAVRGVLEPVQGAQKIVSAVSARVEKIHVTQGEQVERGDILASLATGLHNGEGNSALQVNIAQLMRDKELLQKQLAAQQLEQQQSTYWGELASDNIRDSQISLREEIDLLASRTKVSDSHLRAVSTLLQTGNSSAREYDRQYLAHLALLGSAQALFRKQLQLDYELDSLENAQRISESEFEVASLQTQRELEAVSQRIMDLRNQALFTVVAHESGVVAEVGLEIGNTIQAGQPLFFIHPREPELEATLYVPAYVQAKLAYGQRVLLSYDAFDYRLYGRKEAVVTSIGQARLDPRESALPIPGINEPVFRVLAQLQESKVQGDFLHPLRSGATLTADFVLREMSLLQFILRPLFRLRGKVA